MRHPSVLGGPDQMIAIDLVKPVSLSIPPAASDGG